MFPNYALIANLRNGAWYYDKWDSFCYFKSGDGHDNEWSFSLSRLNLHIAKIVASRGGCIIVDSTRRGKVYPDSLSATIPIWCAVINLLLFEDSSFVPPPWMAPGNAHQIANLIPRLASGLPLSCKSYIQDSLSNQLTSPLIVYWAAAVEGMLQLDGDGVEDLFTDDGCKQSRIILLSCSDDISEADHSSHHSWFYVKGAGDDDENWSQGLSPEVFWLHRERILSSDDPSLVEKAVNEVINYHKSLENRLASVYDLPTCHISCLTVHSIFHYLSSFSEYSHVHVDGIILLLNESEYLLYEQFKSSSTIPPNSSLQILGISYLSGKKHHQKTNYHDIFSAILNFYQNLRECSPSLPTLWIATSQFQFMGIDVAIIVLLLVCYFDHDFNPLLEPSRIPPFSSSISKLDIQVMAGCLQSTLPRCVLGRGFLKELASYFDSERAVAAEEQEKSISS